MLKPTNARQGDLILEPTAHGVYMASDPPVDSCVVTVKKLWYRGGPWTGNGRRSCSTARLGV